MWHFICSKTTFRGKRVIKRQLESINTLLMRKTSPWNRPQQNSFSYFFSFTEIHKNIAKGLRKIMLLHTKLPFLGKCFSCTIFFVITYKARVKVACGIQVKSPFFLKACSKCYFKIKYLHFKKKCKIIFFVKKWCWRFCIRIKSSKS